MLSKKLHYSVEEAADLLNCKPRDVIHLAVQEQITLLVGVPDNVRFRTYDASLDLVEAPALLEPQLLALTQSHCLQIEVNGKTEQSDFREGFLINQAGELQKVMPSYGRPRLDHPWAYWRIYDGSFSRKIELRPERLFVIGKELFDMLSPTPKTAKVKKSTNLSTEEVLASSQQPRESAGVVNVEKFGNAGPNNNPQAPKDRDPLPLTQSMHMPIVSTPPKIIRLKMVRERTGLSRSSIYDKMNPNSPRYDATFPKQVRLGIGSVGWYESDVVRWIESRKPVDSV